MGVGVTVEHEHLRRTAREVLAGLCPPAVPRALLDADVEALPAFWPRLAELGWLGLAVEEEYGGAGLGLAELCVVVAEGGRAALPGPFLPTVLAAAVLSRHGSVEQRKEFLPGLVDGTTPAAVALGRVPRVTEAAADGGLRLTGTVGPVLAGSLARLVLVPVVGGQVAVVDTGSAGVRVQPLASVDRTRRVAQLELDGVAIPAQHVLAVAPDRLVETEPRPVRDLAAVLFAAEACGTAEWCLDTATAHARVREQFGRPIGQFQAVKHRCADLLVAVEQARAATGDAAAALAAQGAGDGARLAVAVAATLALETAVTAGKDCVQILGGIGYSWEHDAHLHLKRALSLRALAGGTEGWQAEVSRLARSGVRRRLTVELPLAAEAVRAEVRAALEVHRTLPDDAARVEWMAAGGWIAPHWPRPHGRGADALAQLVIDEEFRRAKVRRPNLAVGAWALPTLIAHGSPEQQERFIAPTLRGRLTWCQMFSEPGAGSDLAALSTRAERVEGGWSVTGAKVWTSLARWATHAILLVRTAPASPADRRSGITYLVLDMATPGIDVRPLRELTGHEMFNEVFLDDVVVPDDCVVGEVGDGWRLARTTLANERVQMGSGSSFGTGVEGLLRLLPTTAAADDPVVHARIGALVAEAQALALLGMRMTMRALSGAEPGPEASVRKLVAAEHEQRVQEFGLRLLGESGATEEGTAAAWVGAFLATRCMTIAGGTSEVQRNVIAERLLGLPRDPEPPR